MSATKPGVLAVLGRIANTNADFATLADKDFMVRVGQSMLEKQAADLREARATVERLAADLREVSAEMRGRKVNHGRNTSLTLIAWADRIDAAVGILGGEA